MKYNSVRSKSNYSEKTEGYGKKITVLSITLLIILLFLFLIVKNLYSIYMNNHYPSDVLSNDTFAVFSKTMESGRYKPLKDIAENMADNGNGYLLYPVDGKTVFDYEDSVLAKLTTDTGSGFLIVAQGSGDIQKDIIEHIHDYYDFMGRVNPSYDEKVYENGNVNNFCVTYSSGYISTGNFFKENGFYLSAFEYKATNEGSFLFIVYVTEELSELKEQIEMMKQFATYALEGEQDPDGTISENNTVAQSEKSYAEQVTEINEYLYEKYGVTADNSVSNNSSVTVSENSVSDEEIAVEIVDEEQIDVEITD